METINEIIQQIRGYWEIRAWWWGFGMLILWFFIAIWPGAAALAQVFARTHRGKVPVEAWAHLAWALMLALHVGLWLPYGLDNTRLTWYGGVNALTSTLYVVPDSFLEYAFAVAAVLPYLLLPLIELILIYQLAGSYRRLRASGA